jgi:hypothetical protein
MFNTITAFSSVARKKVSGSVGTAPSSANCIAYYKLETTDDSTGTNDLTLTGATVGVATGVIEKGGFFDGTLHGHRYHNG